MDRTLLRLLVISMIALAAGASEPPVTPQAVTKLTFTETSVSAPVTPGAMTAWSLQAREYRGGYLHSYIDARIITDSDNDGLVTYDWIATEKLPWNGVFVVTDLSTGEIMAGSRSTSTIPTPWTLPSDVFLRDTSGNYSQVILPAEGLTFLQLQRPGVGAWSVQVEDGQSSDLDRTFNDRVLFNIASMKAVGATPPPPPGVQPGDVLVGINRDPEAWFAGPAEDLLGDTPGTGTVSFTSPEWSANESAGTLSIPVLRERNSDGEVTVRYAASPANPNPGVHYDDFAGTLTFLPGEIVQTIDIPIIDDTLYSGQTRFAVTLSSPTGATLGEITTAQVEISDSDDEEPTLTAATTSPDGYEGDSGVREVPVTISLSSAAACPLTVDWSWRENWQSEHTGSVTFEPGETQKSFTMTYLANTAIDGLRELHFTAKPVGWFSSASTGKYTVVDDDRPAVPKGLAAQYDGARITISWLAEPKASGYILERASANESWMPIYNGTTTTVHDTGILPGETYVYSVRALDSNLVATDWSPREVATTILFADDPLGAGTVIQSAHVEQLRAAVNAMRAAVRLPAFSFSEPAVPGSPIRASHVRELREALAAARTDLGLPAIAFIDPDIAAGITFKAIHLTELRQGCR